MAKRKKNTSGPVNVGFADKYYGCQVVANIMGLHVETVRRRAKAGTIPAKQDEKGTWVFIHSDLVKAKVYPFAGTILNAQAVSPQGPLPLKPQKKNVTEVIFVLDRSGSMGHLMSQARANLQRRCRKAEGELAATCGGQP